VKVDKADLPSEAVDPAAETLILPLEASGRVERELEKLPPVPAPPPVSGTDASECFDKDKFETTGNLAI